MRKINSLILAVLTVFSVLSCSSDKTKKALLPNVSGKAGEVIVVIDKDNWEGALGTEVRDVLAADCPWLAVQEPLYSLVNVAPTGFADLFKYHRNIVVFNINPQIVTPGLQYRPDVWASPQCVLQINAYTSEDALEIFKEKSESIKAFLEQAERDRVINNSRLYEERSLAKTVNEMFGGSPVFPIGYKLKSKVNDFIWIADEKQYTTQGVFIYKYPAGADADANFQLKNIIAKRNEVMKANVPGMFDNTYMTTATYLEPYVEYVKYKGREFAQTRGFWEVYNDYMGGPFVSHSFYTPDGKDIIVVEAFVYAPRFDKRQYLRQVESIIYSFTWAENTDK